MLQKKLERLCNYTPNSDCSSLPGLVTFLESSRHYRTAYGCTVRQDYPNKFVLPDHTNEIVPSSPNTFFTYTFTNTNVGGSLAMVPLKKGKKNSKVRRLTTLSHNQCHHNCIRRVIKKLYKSKLKDFVENHCLNSQTRRIQNRRLRNRLLWNCRKRSQKFQKMKRRMKKKRKKCREKKMRKSCVPQTEPLLFLYDDAN